MLSSKCRPRLVLFDLDGTIIDTMGEYAEAAAEIISRHTGISREEARRRYLSLSGRSFREQLRLMGVPEDKIEVIAREFEEAKKTILERHRPGKLVWDRIGLLRDCGLRVALSTNNECSLVERIDWMRSLFDIILCHDPEKGIGKGLPHLRVLEEQGYRRCEIVFVGDSDYDLEVYKPYGVRSIRTRGLWKPDDTAIEEILGELGCKT